MADLGGVPSARPPYGPKFSQFHAVFHKIWQNHMLAPPRGLAPPPTGNPGSAPDLYGHITVRSKCQDLPKFQIFWGVNSSQPIANGTEGPLNNRGCVVVGLPPPTNELQVPLS